MNENFPHPPRTIKEAQKIIEAAREVLAETHALFRYIPDAKDMTRIERERLMKVLDKCLAASVGVRHVQ